MENSTVHQSQQKTRDQLALRVIQDIDSDVEAISLQIPFTAVYSADYVSKRWRRAGYEGALYCVRRKYYPIYRLYLLNKLHKKNFIQDITEDFRFSIYDNFVFLNSPQENPAVTDNNNNRNKGTANPSYSKDPQFYSIWSYHKENSSELFQFLQQCVKELRNKSFENAENTYETSEVDFPNQKPSVNKSLSYHKEESSQSPQNGYSSSQSYVTNANKEAGLKIMKLLKMPQQSSPMNSYESERTQTSISTPEIAKEPVSSHHFEPHERPLQPYFDKDLKPIDTEDKHIKEENKNRNNKVTPSTECQSDNIQSLPLQQSTHHNFPAPLPQTASFDNKKYEIDSIMTEPLKLIMDLDNISHPKKSFVNSLLPKSKKEGKITIDLEDLNIVIGNILKKSETREFFSKMIIDELNIREDSFKNL